MNPQQLSPGLAQLAQLQSVGLVQDPLSQLSGLINLVNASQVPQMQTRELDLREQNMQMDNTNAIAQQDIAMQELAMRKQAQMQNDAQFAQDLALRKALADQNLGMEYMQYQQQKAYQQQILGLQALGLPAQYSGSAYPVNTDALQPAMQATGLLGLFNPQAAAGGVSMPQGLNADQQALWQVRQRMFPQQAQPQQ